MKIVYTPEIIVKIFSSILIIIMKTIAKKILFPVFMGKIVNSFSYAMTAKINEPRHEKGI